MKVALAVALAGGRTPPQPRLTFFNNSLNLVLAQSTYLHQKRKVRHRGFQSLQTTKHWTESLIWALWCVAVEISVKPGISKGFIGQSCPLSQGLNIASYTTVSGKSPNRIIDIVFLLRKGSLKKSNFWLFGKQWGKNPIYKYIGIEFTSGTSKIKLKDTFQMLLLSQIPSVLQVKSWAGNTIKTRTGCKPSEAH